MTIQKNICLLNSFVKNKMIIKFTLQFYFIHFIIDHNVMKCFDNGDFEHVSYKKQI